MFTRNSALKIIVFVSVALLLAGTIFSQNEVKAKTEQGAKKQQAKPEPIKPEKVIKIEGKEEPKPTTEKGAEKVSVVPDDITKLKPAPEPDVVAKVGENYISKKNLDGQLALLLNDYKDYPDETKAQLAKKLRKQALEFLIYNELVVLEAKKKGISVSDDEVNEEFDVFVKNIKGGREKLDEIFKQYKITDAEFKSRMKKEILIKKTMAVICEPKSSLSDEEIKKIYETNKKDFTTPDQIRVSQIMLRFKDGETDKDKADKKKKLEETIDKIKKGSDFAESAKEISEGPTAQNGGDMGYFIRKKDYIPTTKFPFLPEQIENVVFGLKKDELTGIIENESGYQVLKVTDFIPTKQAELSEVKQDIIDVHKDEQQTDIFTKWSENAAKNTPIEVYQSAFKEEPITQNNTETK